jgi:hypothetical protein
MLAAIERNTSRRSRLDVMLVVRFRSNSNRSFQRCSSASALISKAPQIISGPTKEMMTDFALGSQVLPVARRLGATE